MRTAEFMAPLLPRGRLHARYAVSPACAGARGQAKELVIPSPPMGERGRERGHFLLKPSR